MTAAGNYAGIVVSEEIIESLGAGGRPAVVVNNNGFEYRSTIGVMAGTPLISISAAVREQTGLKAGDPIHVVRTLTDRPSEVTVPDDLAAAYRLIRPPRYPSQACPTACSHVDNINAAKTAETSGNGRSRRSTQNYGLAAAVGDLPSRP